MSNPPTVVCQAQKKTVGSSAPTVQWLRLVSSENGHTPTAQTNAAIAGAQTSQEGQFKHLVLHSHPFPSKRYADYIVFHAECQARANAMARHGYCIEAL